MSVVVEAVIRKLHLTFSHKLYHHMDSVQIEWPAVFWGSKRAGEAGKINRSIREHQAPRSRCPWCWNRLNAKTSSNQSLCPWCRNPLSAKSLFSSAVAWMLRRFYFFTGCLHTNDILYQRTVNISSKNVLFVKLCVPANPVIFHIS